MTHHNLNDLILSAHLLFSAISENVPAEHLPAGIDLLIRRLNQLTDAIRAGEFENHVDVFENLSYQIIQCQGGLPMSWNIVTLRWLLCLANIINRNDIVATYQILVHIQDAITVLNKFQTRPTPENDTTA